MNLLMVTAKASVTCSCRFLFFKHVAALSSANLSNLKRLSTFQFQSLQCRDRLSSATVSSCKWSWGRGSHDSCGERRRELLGSVLGSGSEGHGKWKHSNAMKGTSLGFALFGVILIGKKSDGRKEEFYSRLYVAVYNGKDLDLKQLLNEHEVDINGTHFEGQTALQVAAFCGHSSTVKLLIEAGADPNVKDECISMADKTTKKYNFTGKLNDKYRYTGLTALHYAALSNDYETVKILLENGANPLATNHEGDLLARQCAKDQSIKGMIDAYTVMDKKKRSVKKEMMVEERSNFPLEKQIRDAIVGQEGAITTVASTIRRKEMGWSFHEHPVVFLFLGSSGIGKTELAKQIAQYLHKGKREGFIRIDMSEYHDRGSVARIIGSPPGYVGYKDGGQLTKRLEQCPNAVVLFDEVEKAHPDVLNVLLQLFDEGRITDGEGKTIECKQAIFVMTSNLASEEITEYALKFREGGNEAEGRVVISPKFKDKVVRPILKAHFKQDEFLGRINEIVYFLPFSKSELNGLITKSIWQRKQKRNIALN